MTKNSLTASFAVLARLFKTQQKTIAELTEQVDEQKRYWQAVGKPIRTGKKDTGYFTDRGKLLSLMEEHFSVDDIEDICFELGVFHDKLPGIGVRGKSRSLIQHFEQRTEIYKLLDEIKQRRPHIEWPTF